MSYAELHCLSNFSFLRGASQPGGTRRACRAARLCRARDHRRMLGGGRRARARRGPRTAVQAHRRRGVPPRRRPALRAARAEPAGIRPALPPDHARTACCAQGRIPARAQRLPRHLDGCLCLWLPAAKPEASDARWFAQRFPGRVWLAVELLTTGRDRRRQRSRCRRWRARSGLPLVATGDVHMHARGRRALQDVLTATRLGTTVDQAGLALFPNGERHLRPVARIAELHPAGLLAATLDIAARCTFSLDELRYEYPREIVPEGYTPSGWLRQLTEEGKRHRWPAGVPAQAGQAIEHELALIEELALRSLFPDRARHRALRALARHPLPGSRLGRQLGRVLLPRHHRGRSGAHVAAVRALHLARAQRTTRHRRRFRARAARGGDPVPLRASTAGSGRRSPPRSSATGRAARSATWPRRWGSMRCRSRRWRGRCSGGTDRASTRAACARPASIPTARCCRRCSRSRTRCSASRGTSRSTSAAS